MASGTLSARGNAPWVALSRYALVWIPLVYLGIFFVLPLARVLSFSVYDDGFTWRHFVSLGRQSVYLGVLQFTLFVSIVSTALTILVAYPVSYLISRQSPGTARILLVFVVVPLFTCGLIRVFAWAELLAPQGAVNQALKAVGLVDQPLKLSYNAFGLFVANVHILLPYMILSLLATMRGIDTRLVAAATTLGATPVRAFFTVFVPLTMPGVIAGSVVVFMLSMGAYIIPALLGGPKQAMIAMIIESEVMDYLHWGFAAALATVLFAVTGLVVYLQQKYVGSHRFGGSLERA